MPSSVFYVFTSLTLVSDLYGLMRRILYLIFVAPYCNSTVPLVKTVLSQMGPYTTFYISYAVRLMSMKLSPTL